MPDPTPEEEEGVSPETIKKFSKFLHEMKDMSTEQVNMLKDLASIVKDTPEEEQSVGVYHPIVVKFYEKQIKGSMGFLKETNERGFPAVAQEILSRHVLPMHKFLTYQFNSMIKQSQKHMKQRMK